MLRSFPIKLVYTVRDEMLLVVAVFHTSPPWLVGGKAQPVGALSALPRRTPSLEYDYQNGRPRSSIPLRIGQSDYVERSRRVWTDASLGV
jgi:hypothetical protein